MSDELKMMYGTLMAKHSAQVKDYIKYFIR